MPGGFQDGLSEIYGDELSELQLLPVDEQTARTIVGERDFPRILDLIDKADLAAIAGYPCVLEALREEKELEPQNRVDVWHALLLNLLKTPYFRRDRDPDREFNYQFDAVSRLAIALTFGPDEEIVAEASRSQGLRITNILPTDEGRVSLSLSQPRETLRSAGYESLKSGMFQRTATGHRFAQRNIRDWMCAWALRRWPLEKVKPLLLARSAGRGEIHPAYREIAKLLEDVVRQGEENNQRLAEWLGDALGDIPEPPTASPWSIGRVRDVLDRLEARATQGGWLWLDERKLANLVTPGLGGELALRFADTTKSAPARAISLSVAAATKSTDILGVASEVILDETENIHLRTKCAYLIRRLGDNSDLRPLIAFVEAANPVSRSEMRLTSALISALVERRIWTPLDAFPHLPAGTRDQVIDAVAVLPSEISGQMSLQDARSIIELASHDTYSEITSLLEAEESPSSSTLRQPPKVQVFLEAVQKVVDLPEPRGDDLEALIPFCMRLGDELHRLDHSLTLGLQKAFKAKATARRRLFDEYTRALLTRPHHLPRLWGAVLEPEDLEWLLDKISRSSGNSDDLWAVLLSLASHADIPASLAEQARALAQDRAPQFLADFDEQQNIQRQWEEKSRKARDEARQEKLRSIEEINREILNTKEPGSAALFWSLSWVNFSEQGFQPANVEGHWSDLSEDVRNEILEECARALDKVTPTPIPDGRTFPRSVVYEGQAFIRLAQEYWDKLDLTPRRIRKWLGSALCFPIPGNIEVLERCFYADEQATEATVLEEIKREVRSSEDQYSVLLQDLPEANWTEAITTWVEEQVLSGEVPATARIPFLRLLGGRKPSRARAVARTLLDETGLAGLRGALWLTEPDGDLDLAVANVLLALDPDAVWNALKNAIVERGNSLLAELRVLVGPIHGGLQAHLERWPVKRIEELASFLFDHFPPETDPSFEEAQLVTADIELRNLRWTVLDLLFAKQDSKSSEFLHRLSEQHPEVTSWLEHRRAIADLDALSEADPEPSQVSVIPDGHRLSRHQICKVIQSGDYHLVRNAGDLLDVVIAQLEAIGKTVPDHLDMLYSSGRTGPGKNPKHQHESALQAYILCRLYDRLPGRVLDRETQIKWRRRTDIRVVSPTTGGEPATIVIEVKWSDHKDISTALKTQLGRQYLYEQELTHGIYLVGWCGEFSTWRRSENPRPKSRDMESFRRALGRQATELADSYPKVHVRSCVINCSWRQDG